MVRESMKVREVKRQKLVIKYAAKRKALKEAGDYDAPQFPPEDTSSVRLHSRCKLAGWPKGYMYTFGISCVLFREMTNKGSIPDVKKASW